MQKSFVTGYKCTACGPSGVYVAGLGTAARGTETEGARAPFGGAQVWSVNNVLISGFCLGFLQS